jgi:lipopolysaccharide transport system ATP-binding protein
MSDGSSPRGWIRAEGLWKQFRLGERHDSLRDLLPALFGRALGGGAGGAEPGENAFWALRDLSFEVRPGQALGVIGGNGAGKSTLLKLLTRIVRPTRGWCEVRGRIGALIEIAAGFHPDLTGRENVFLQGAIMGMRNAEIRAQFDRIVEFSGVSRFIDTPVKRFSSGMGARLGFSIAAHLDPDVLIIDEVLAVGDFQFQTKAFDRIRTMVQQDIPVVVVSHQLDRISSLCTHAILLDRGSVVAYGSPAECIAAYVQGRTADESDAEGSSPVVISSIHGPTPGEPVGSGKKITLTMGGFTVPHDRSKTSLSLGIRVRALDSGQVILDVGTVDHGMSLPDDGPFELDTELDFNVAPGIYSIEPHVWDPFEEVELGRGPSLTIEVRGGPKFWGTVQMNPRMRFHAPSSAAPVAPRAESARS